MDARKTVFLGYSNRDESWVDRVRAKLKPLSLRGDIEVFDDASLPLGKPWDRAFEQQVEEAAAAILFLSPAYFETNFEQSRELPRFVERARRDPTFTLIPLLVEPCDWQSHRELASLQLYPPGAVPLSSMEFPQQEALLERLAGILDERLTGAPSSAKDGALASFGPDPSQAAGADAESALRRFSFSSEAARVMRRARFISGLKRKRGDRNILSTSSILFSMLESGRGSGTHLSPTTAFLASRIDATRYREVLDDIFDTTNPSWPSPDDNPEPERGNTGTITENTVALLEEAQRLAMRTTRSPTIHIRHLVASLLTLETPRPPRARRRLQMVVQSFETLRGEFAEFVPTVAPIDDVAQWAAILGAQVETILQRPTPAEGVESVRQSSVSDQPTATDALGFKTYVDAMAEFLVTEETRPPLTVSLEGRWGCGKSSFMQQIEERVIARSREVSPTLRQRFERAWRSPSQEGERSWKRFFLRLGRCWRARGSHQVIAVRFNAWRHDREDALWSAFATEFLAQVREERFFLWSWLGSLSLMIRRWSWARMGIDALRKLALVLSASSILLGAAYLVHFRHWENIVEKVNQSLATEKKDEKTTKEVVEAEKKGAEEKTAPDAKSAKEGHGDEKQDPVAAAAEWLVRLGGLSGAFGLVLTFALRITKSGVLPPFDRKRYEEAPDYESHAEFLAQFHEDFRRVIAALAGNHRICVFIDDLDRCQVPKAADLMQAINLMMSDDPHMIFVIGMDREKVAAGIAAKNKELLPYLPPGPNSSDALRGLEFGYDFVEKFIQIPFAIPTPDEFELRRFLASLARDAWTAESLARELVPRVIMRSAATETETGVKAEPPTSGSAASAKAKELSAAAAGGAREIESPPSPGKATAVARPTFDPTLSVDSNLIREIAVMAAPTLENNPRRMKQFINLFRLRAFIAHKTGLLGGPAGPPLLTLEQLGKVTALGLRWPLLMNAIAEHPTLLASLEKAARVAPSERDLSDPLVAAWHDRPNLLALLRHRATESAYSIASVDTSLLLRLQPSRTTAASS
jgi:hypothetical protein